MFENREWGFFAVPKEKALCAFKDNKDYMKNLFKNINDTYEYILVFIPYEHRNKLEEATIYFEYYHYDNEEQYRFGFSGYDLTQKLLREELRESKVRTNRADYQQVSFYIDNEITARSIVAMLNDEYKKKYPLMSFSKDEPLVPYKNLVEAFKSKDDNEEWDVVRVNNKRFITYNRTTFMDITDLPWDDNDARFVVMLLREAYFSGYSQAEINNMDNEEEYEYDND